MQKLPTGLVPNEDKGDIMVFYYLMPASSLERTAEVQTDVNDLLRSNPNVRTVGSMAGIDLMTFAYKTDAGSKRKENSMQIAGQLNGIQKGFCYGSESSSHNGDEHNRRI